MKLNQGKCELIAIKGERKHPIWKWENVPKKAEAKYLGCRINEKET